MAQIVRDCAAEGPGFAILILLFILIATLTVMNMLVGVLVEVVGVVSAVEKEQLTVSYVKMRMVDMLSHWDRNSSKVGAPDANDVRISKAEFERLLSRPEAARVIQEVGVDVIGLVDSADYIFAESEDDELS